MTLPTPACSTLLRLTACVCSTIRSGRMQASTAAPTGAPFTLTPAMYAAVGQHDAAALAPLSARAARTVPLQHRAVADEAGDEAVRRRLVHAVDGVNLLDVAVVEHRDAVAHRERLALVVGDVDEGDAELAVQAPSARSACARATACRARQAARPSARAAARTPARAPARRAAADHPIAAPGSARPCRPAEPCASARATRCARLGFRHTRARSTDRRRSRPTVRCGNSA